jgi:hypothetical protein
MAILKYYNTATSAWEYIAASTTANFTSWKKTMSGGETSVSGTDDNAVTLSYTVGLEQVFINGVLQVRGADYTATDGTSIDSLSALVANDIVTVVCYAPFNVANTIAPTVVDAKGDLLAGTAADTVGRLAVGTDGQLLAADSGETTGLKWTTPASGGLTLLSTTTFSAVASQSVNDVFSATYTNYKIIVNAKSSSANAVIFSFRFRVSGADDSTSNYRAVGIGRRAGSTTVSIDNPGTSTTLLELPALSGVHENLLQFEISNPFSAKTKGLTGTNFGVGGDGSTGNGVYVFGGGFFTTTSFTGFSLIPGSGTMTGSISVYGYNE